MARNEIPPHTDAPDNSTDEAGEVCRRQQQSEDGLRKATLTDDVPMHLRALVETSAGYRLNPARGQIESELKMDDCGHAPKHRNLATSFHARRHETSRTEVARRLPEFTPLQEHRTNRHNRQTGKLYNHAHMQPLDGESKGGKEARKEGTSIEWKAQATAFIHKEYIMIEPYAAAAPSEAKLPKLTAPNEAKLPKLTAPNEAKLPKLTAPNKASAKKLGKGERVNSLGNLSQRPCGCESRPVELEPAAGSESCVVDG